MRSRARLRVVPSAQVGLDGADRQKPPTDQRAERLRRLIRERDEALRTVATCERHIAHEARRWADAHGLTLRPTIEQLKRALFGGAQ